MSKWRNSQSWRRGQEVEKEFVSILKRYNIKWRKANREEQFQHIDYFTAKGTIDVKARKRINRSDNDEQDELVWVEFKNL